MKFAFCVVEPLEDRTLFAAVKIMPLGDSITSSVTGHDSYRRPLYQSLISAGYTNIDFVGSQYGVNGGLPPDTDFDMDNEGHYGWRADEIEAQLAGWANTYKPDIVLLHLGTNDLNQNQTVSSTITDLGSIIDTLRAANSKVTILLAEIIPDNLTPTTITQLNAQIPTLVSQKNTSTSRVIAVDQWTGFSSAADTFDGVHPNASGEAKMAAKWYSALTPFLTVSAPPPAGTYLSDLTPTVATNGWGPYEKDKSNGETGSGDGSIITLNSTTYTKGLGVHANSELDYTLGGQYSQFISDIGVDDEVGSAGSVDFQVYDNLGNKLYDSGTMTGSTATKSITLDVTGKQTLRLLVTDAGDGNNSDHADWAYARLIKSTASPIVVNAFSGATINEGGTYTASGSFTDSGAGPWTASVNYGDGSGSQALTLTGKTFALSHLYADNGNYNVTVTVSSAAANGSNSAAVICNDVPPTISMPPNGSVNYGSAWTGAGSFTDPGTLDTFTATVDYGDGAGAIALALNSNKTFNLSKNYSAGGTFTVSVKITDKDGGSSTKTSTVTVNGGPVQTTVYLSDLTPTTAVNGWGPYEKDKSNGEQAQGDGHTITMGGVTYAKGLGVHASSELDYNLAGGNYATFSAMYGMDDEVNGQGSTHFQVWLDGTMAFDSGTVRGGAAKLYTVSVAGKSTLKLVVTDNGDGNANDHADWGDAKLIKNTSPVFAVNAIPAGAINEGGVYTASGSFTDPTSTGPWTATVDYGDGSGAQALSLNADKSFSLNHLYLDNGSYLVSVKVNNSTTIASNSAVVGVANIAPTVALGASGNTGTSFSRAGSFTDPGVLDTFTATVDYGDGAGAQSLSLNADKSFTLNHVYVYNGTYPVKVTVLDKDGGAGTSTVNMTVTGGQNKTSVFLSDLTPTVAINGWGSYEKDHSNGEQGSNDGGTITLGGVTYAKGLGVHASSELDYNLAGGNYSTFSTDYGLDDEVNGLGSVQFQVWLDGVMVFNSATVKGGAAKSYSVSVVGKSTLKLVVTDAGDGNSYDHADWANAKLS